MRIVPTLLAAALGAATLLPGTAQAAGNGWSQTSRVAYYSLTSVREGQVPGRDGNWHTIVLSVNGADGVSGEVTDWSCPDGVTPDLGALDGGCTALSARTIADALDQDGASLVQVTVNRPNRNLVVTGRVAVTDEAGVESVGRIHLIGHAFGARTTEVADAEDGLTRTYTVTRERTKSVGRVLGLRLQGRRFSATSSAVVTVTTWTQSAPSAFHW